MDTVLLLLTFEGRLNRARYWTALIALTAVIAATAVVVRLIVPALGWSIHLAVSTLLALIIGVPWLVGMLAINVKRLHDLDFSGWWMLYAWLVEFNVVIEAVSQTAVEYLIGYAIMIGGQVIIGIPRGTAGTNRFGPDPQSSA